MLNIYVAGVATLRASLSRILRRAQEGPLASSATNPNSAEGDPVPTSPNFFYNNDVGTRRLEPVEDPSPRFSGRGAGTALNSLSSKS